MKKSICLFIAFLFAVLVKGQTAEDYLNMGFKKADNQDYKGFIADLDKAIKLDPKYESAYYNRGTAKLLLNDYNGAIADYTKVIEIKPLNASAYTNRGLAKNYLKDHKGAIDDFSKAIEVNPELVEAYQTRGTAKIETGQTESACLDFEKALSLGSPQATWSINKYCKFYYNPSSTIYKDNKCQGTDLIQLFASIQSNNLKNFTASLGIIKNVNDTCNGYTSLMLACESHNVKFAKTLLSKGADIHYKTKLGTPLFLSDYRNYLGIDTMQINCTEFVIKNLLSSIEKNSQWIATKNHLPNAQDIRLGIVDALIKRGRSTSDAYTLIQFYDITVVDATKGEFNVQCDVSMVDKKITQMLDIVNVSGINLQEPKGVVSHMVLCSDLPKVAGGLADMGFSLEKAEKWTFYFSINNTKKWDVEIRDKQTLK